MGRPDFGGNNPRRLLSALCLFALLLQPLLLNWQFVKNLEAPFQDYLVRMRAAEQEPSSDIVVIDIDDTSLQAMAQNVGKWPWSRAVHAELLEYLLQQQPRAVIFDILFSEPDIYRPDDDRYFAEVLAENDRVYLSALEQKVEAGQAPLLSSYPPRTGLIANDGANPNQRGMLLLPLALPPDVWNLGTINFLADPDGVGRRHELYRDFGGWSMPSLAAAVAKDLGADLPSRKSIILDWQSDNAMAYQRLPYVTVLSQARGEAKPYPANFFQDRIVIIGTTASGLHDLRSTPVSKVQPAVFILATAIDNLLHGKSLQYSSLPILLAGSVLILLVWAFTLEFSLRYGVVCALSGCGLLLWYVTHQAAQGVLVPVFPALLSTGIFVLSMMLVFYQRYLRKLRITVAQFSQMLDPAVVKQLLKHDNPEATLTSKSCEITVLFSDIRNFTTLSESRTPDEMVNLLNHYFDRQVKSLFQHRATLDKFIGDAIMAFWGAPVDCENHAEQAINAALDMVKNLDTFKQEFGDSEFDIGIGVHTGEAVVGMIGAKLRYDYTAIGDTVNVSSRIEGLTKGRARVLVSEATKIAAGDCFYYEPCGEFQVKGRSETINVYEPRRK